MTILRRFSILDSFMLFADLHVGKTFIFDCKFTHNLTAKPVAIKMLFDTGASNSGICISTLKKAGYSLFTPGNAPRQTAIGEITFDRCEVKNFRLENFRPRDFRIDVLPREYKGFQGVLGMDYIGILETWISNSKGKIHISGSLQKFRDTVLDLTQ